MTKIKSIVSGVGFAALAFVLSAQNAFAQYSPASSTEDVNNAIADIGTSFGGIIVVILSFFAALVGLGMGIRYFKRWVGRK